MTAESLDWSAFLDGIDLADPRAIEDAANQALAIDSGTTPARVEFLARWGYDDVHAERRRLAAIEAQLRELVEPSAEAEYLLEAEDAPRRAREGQEAAPAGEAVELDLEALRAHLACLTASRRRPFESTPEYRARKAAEARARRARRQSVVTQMAPS